MHWSNLKYLIRHKWYVFKAGLFFKVPIWNLIIHDWSKLLPSEWFPYARYFYAKAPMRAYKPALEDGDFLRAWLYHQRRNPHHWQYWVLILDDNKGDVLILEMPEKYAREMVADWVGAGMAQGYNDPWNWYATNKEQIRLHSKTQQLVENLLEQYREAQQCKLPK